MNINGSYAHTHKIYHSGQQNPYNEINNEKKWREKKLEGKINFYSDKIFGFIIYSYKCIEQHLYDSIDRHKNTSVHLCDGPECNKRTVVTKREMHIQIINYWSAIHLF